MQVRLWYRRAGSGQRAALVTTGVAAVALLVTSVAVGGGGGGPAPGGAESLASGPAAQAGPGAQAAGSRAPGASSPATGVAAAGSLQGTGPSQAAPTQPAGTGGPASSPGTPGPGGPAAGTSPSAPAGGASPVRLTAADRGVTPTTIKIGFTTVNLAGLSGSGFVVGLRSDSGTYAKALADYVNAHGGVDGRRLVVTVRPTDPTSQSDQAAACQSMVSDQQVFGVIDEASMSDTAAMDCLAVQHQTPYVHNLIWSTQWLARSGGMEVGYPAAIDRESVTWAHDLGAMGWLDGHPTVGILGDQCEATKPVISGVLQPALLRSGAGKVVIGDMGCDPQAVASDPTAFAAQFRAEGVTRVLLASNAVSSSIFVKAAAQEQWHPKFSVTDWWQLASDAATVSMDAGEFDGAIAITADGIILPQSGRAPRPGGQLCNQIATGAGLPPLQYNSANVEMWTFCDNFLLMVAGLKAAGPNPTRTGWARAVQGLGTMNSVIYGPSVFRPGKVTGSDQVFTARWSAGCACYKAISGFRPASA